MSSTAAAHSLFAARPRSAVLIDAALAAVAFAGALLTLSHDGGPAHPAMRELDPIAVVLAACSALPLMAWRRAPLGVFVVTASARAVLAGLGYPAGLIFGPVALLGPVAALYLLAASRERANPWTWRTTAIVGGMLAAYLVASGLARGNFPALELVHTGLAWAVAWFAGERTRLRREQFAELSARASRAEREVERERLLAVAEERARIARDLHDSAGHAISVIAMRAGAARLRHHKDPDRSLRALADVEQLARHTADDIDHIIGTLRRDGPAGSVVEAPHGLASLGDLIADHAAARLRVRVETTGRPRPLSAAADQAAYRILQEALTNAARHGSGSAAVELGFGGDGLELTVTNPVPGGGPSRAAGGHGLIGMRERAILLGGSFEAGHTGGGAFRVRATIPYGGHRA